MADNGSAPPLGVRNPALLQDAIGSSDGSGAHGELLREGAHRR
jgi:hypothetical protein